MANDEIIIKVGTDVDKAPLQDLEDTLNQISNNTIKFQPEVDTAQIQELESEIEELESKAVLQEMFGDTTGVEQTQLEIEALQQQIESLNASAESIDGTGFDSISTGADTATDSVEGLSESLDGLSMLAVGDVLQQYGSQAEEMAQSMNEANITVGQLATQTGIAEPQLRNMVASITNATFPTDEAMMYIKSLDQIGVSANNLGSSATSLDMINDAFGLGADTVNSLGQELSVLGVDMNNVSSSFDALAYANANTVGGMDNYFAFLRKYDSQFKELGINVDQASVIIAGATQKFGGGRAALSGLSNILKESNGDLSVMEQRLGLTAGSLKNANQLTGKYTGQLKKMADQEAEHKTLLDEIGSAWDRMSLVMGDALSPIGSLIGSVGQFIGVGTQLNGTLELFSKFGGLAGKLNITTIATNALSVAQGILNAVMAMNPIMLVVMALALLVGGLVLAYQNVDWFRQMVDGAWQKLTELATNIRDNVSPSFDTLKGKVSEFTSHLGVEKDSWINHILTFVASAWYLPMKMGEIFLNTIGKAMGFKNNFGTELKNAASNAVTNFMDWIRTLPGKLEEELNKMLDMAGKFAVDIGNKMTFGGLSAVTGWEGTTGEHSPGYMYDMFTGELKAMEGAPRQFDLSGGMRDAGSSMVKSFNPNIGSSSAGIIGTNNITINVESVDNEDRIQEIVNAVEEALAFDNLTAGRTV